MKSKRIRKNKYKNRESSPADGFIKWRAVVSSAVKIVGAIMFVLILSLVFMFGHDMVTQCNYFNSKSVKVTGNSRLAANDIKRISGIYEGVNILSVNMALARKKLLASPWIRSADIRRNFFPTMDMEIHVVENHPKAIIDFGRFFLINARGRVFMEVDPSDFPGIPVISGVEYSQWNQDQGQTRAFSSVMAVLNLVKKGVWPFNTRDLKRIEVDPETGVTLLTETAVEKIRIGFGQYKRKARRLSKIMSLPETVRRFSAFYMMDLRSPDGVVARPRPAEKAAFSS